MSHELLASFIEGLREEVELMDLSIIVDASWRVYPAAALALYGLVLLAKGLWFGFAGSKGLLKERDALGWMRGFRLAVVGLCLAGIGIAWAWHMLWLFVVSVGILGEELLETSVIIEALKRAPASRVRAGGHAAGSGRVATRLAVESV